MPSAGQRLDKWLWFARIIKTRTMAGRLIAGGKVRLNRARVRKAAQPVKPGDVITATLYGAVRILRIEACGTRRGPAAEAAGLFIDLTPPTVPGSKRSALDARAGARQPGSGRPTKRDRRDLDKFLQYE